MKFEIGGETWEWNGFTLSSSPFHIIKLSAEPTEEQAELVVGAYWSGCHDGKHIGRSILQNEFRNLMDCQPR